MNTGAKTIKLLEESVAVNFPILEFGNRLLDVIPKSQTTKEEIHLSSSRLVTSVHQKTVPIK